MAEVGVLMRSELRTIVRDNVKRSTDGLSDASINTWLNWGQGYIADLHTYEEMRKIHTGATTASQKRYGFPLNMKDIYSIALIDGASSRKLIYVSPREFVSKVPYPEQTTKGRSAYYVDYGINFELYRIPDKAYTLELRSSVYPVDFASDSSTSSLYRKDLLIVAVATWFGFLSLRETEDADYWLNTVIPPLYRASLESDHDAEDWTPIARGFDTKLDRIGEYWSNPLVRTMP